MTLKYAQRPSEDICFRDNFISNDYVTDNGGTIYNAPTISNEITTNGSTQYVDYGDVCNLGSDDFSFSFKISFASAGTQEYIFSKWEDGNNRWYVRRDDTGRVFMFCVIGGVTKISAISAASAVSAANTEYDIAIVGNWADTIRFYVNGVESVGSAATFTNADITNTGPLRVGRTDSNYGAFTMKNLSISNRALVLDETLDIYQADTFREIDASKAVISLPLRSSFIEPTGVNLVVDGDCEATGVAAWTVANDATLTKSTDSPQAGTQALRVAYNGTSTPGAYQTIVPVGKRYRITGYARGDGSFAPEITTGAGAAIVTGLTSSTSWQYYDVIFIAINSTIIFRSSATSAGWAEFDTMTAELAPTVTENIGTEANAIMGDGSTTNTMPTLKSPHGIINDALIVGTYMSIPDNANLRTASVSVFALVKPQRDSAARNTIVSSGNPGAYAINNFAFEYINGTGLRLFGRTDGASVTVADVLKYNQWNSVAFTCDGTTTKLYANDKLVASGAIVTGTDNTTGTYIGCVNRGTIDYCLEGEMDAIQQFPFVLTPTQIKELSNNAFANLNV